MFISNLISIYNSKMFININVINMYKHKLFPIEYNYIYSMYRVIVEKTETV